MAQDRDEMSKVSFTFRYAGSALDAGLIDVKELAPALLSIGNLCEQANYRVNGDESRASVQIRAVSPGSFVVEFYLFVSFLHAVKKLFDSDTFKTAREVFGLAKDTIETAKALKGRKVENVTELTDGSKRLVIEHQHTIDLAPPLYAMLASRSVQDDLKGIIAPLKAEGVERLEILQDGDIVESVDVGDIDSFEALPRALPSPEDEVIETTSTIERAFKVITVSSDPRIHWKLSDGSNTYGVKVDDKSLLEMAKEGHLGIEPGFIIRARIKSETRFVGGEPKTANHLLAVLNKKPPEPPQQTATGLPSS